MSRESRPHRHKRGMWRFRYLGKSYYRRSEAEAWALLHSLKRGSGGESRSKRPPKMVAELIHRYLQDHPAAADKVHRFEDFAGDDHLADVDPDYLARFARRIRRETSSAWSVVAWVGTARYVLRYGAERGWLRMPLPVKLREPPRDPRPLRAEDVVKIMAALNDKRRRRAAACLRFILATGCRPGEAIALHWPDVDLRAGTATLREHKTAGSTGSSRVIYLTPAAVAVLREVKHRRGLVFPSKEGKPFTVSGLRSSFRRAAREALNDDGLEIGTYRLRHTFAQLASERLPVDTLQVLMGHASLVTTQRYYRLRDERAAAAAKGLTFPV